MHQGLLTGMALTPGAWLVIRGWGPTTHLHQALTPEFRARLHLDANITYSGLHKHKTCQECSTHKCSLEEVLCPAYCNVTPGRDWSPPTKLGQS